MYNRNAEIVPDSPRRKYILTTIPQNYICRFIQLNLSVFLLFVKLIFFTFTFNVIVPMKR